MIKDYACFNLVEVNLNKRTRPFNPMEVHVTKSQGGGAGAGEGGRKKCRDFLTLKISSHFSEHLLLKFPNHFKAQYLFILRYL